MSSTICITGTGTGVGKTLLTALLTIHLRNKGVNALAIKPYCSGSLDDARLLWKANEGCLALKDISPVYCREPVAPLAVLNSEQATEHYLQVQDHITSMQAQCNVLLIEGVGGAAVPLTKNQTIGDLMEQTGGLRINVTTNRLGVLNETLLVESYFSNRKGEPSRIVLMQPKTPDPSTQSNSQVLQEVLGNSSIFALPYLAGDLLTFAGLNTHEKKLRKTLVQIIK